jgi:hypothetical protein
VEAYYREAEGFGGFIVSLCGARKIRLLWRGQANREPEIPITWRGRPIQKALTGTPEPRCGDGKRSKPHAHESKDHTLIQIVPLPAEDLMATDSPRCLRAATSSTR